MRGVISTASSIVSPGPTIQTRLHYEGNGAVLTQITDLARLREKLGEWCSAIHWPHIWPQRHLVRTTDAVRMTEGSLQGSGMAGAPAVVTRRVMAEDRAANFTDAARWFLR